MFETTLNRSSKMKVRLALAMLFSVSVHLAGLMMLWAYPLLATALGLRHIEFVEEDFNRAILIDFSRPLSYPPGYLGFRAPQEIASLEKVKAEEERRRRLEAERRKREEAAKREEEEKARAEQQAKAGPAPTPTPRPDGYAGGFGKINTAPIKAQIERLYQAKKAGLLVFNENKLRIGVEGRVKADGSLTNYRLIIPSGNPDVDRAALAILEAVSESRALGPLHQLTSLSLILDIDQQAQLIAVGFTSTAQEAVNIEALANLALWDARRRKAEDPAVMVILNNLKVRRSGQRVEAIITMPRQQAVDTLTMTMERGKG